MKTRDWLLLILLSIIWGSSFIFIKISLRELTPFTIVFVRLAIAALFMTVTCKVLKLQFPVGLRQWLALGFLGIINSALPFFLIAWAQLHLDSATTSILNATSPVFIMILAHLFTDDEKLTRYKVTGVAAGILGIIVMVSPSIQKGVFLAGFAQLAVLCGTLNYAFAALYVRRFKNINAMMVSAVSLMGASVFLLPGLLVIDIPPVASLSNATLASVSILGVICTGLAYIIYFSVIASAGATNGMLVTLLIPVSAVFMSSVFLGETIKSHDIIGMLLIFSGLLIIDGRILRALNSSARRQNA